MSDRYDVAILGAGPGGEHAAYALIDAGRRVLVVERELIGGECTNWACIPTKTLLRPTEVRAESERAAGTEAAALDWAALAHYRDYMTSAGDDSARVESYRRRGATVVKGSGRLAGPGALEVDGVRYEADRILISTGSEPVIPPLPGLKQAGYWTNREATALQQLPASAVVLGGGPVGVELTQFLRRFGVAVTIVQGGDRLAPREDPRVSEWLADALRADGVVVSLGVQAERASASGSGRVLHLGDGGQAEGEVLIIATGRRPRSHDIGLETIGIELDPDRPGPIPIDEHCRVADGVWAAGDCTGVALFTHIAKYQARIAMADMAGRPRPADYAAVPRVIFTDPEVGAVGLTADAARAAGHDVVTARLRMDAVARAYTYEQDPRGELELVFDRGRRVMLGAWAVAPQAGEWIHQAVLAIRAGVTHDVLLDTIPQFPSFSEAYLQALQQLAF